jgi:soluble lytic murein transglycosylase-like protein
MVDRIAFALVRECEAHRLDPRVVAALISRESSFNPKATNPSGGARGLGQLMPDTARWLGVQDPYDPDQNIAGICKYLAHLRDRWAGGTDWVKILASYRLGQGTIKRSIETTGTIPPVGLEYAQEVLGRASRITSLG